LALTCLAQDKFKETEKPQGAKGTPPSIKIPDNLRLRIVLTESFNFAIGLDLSANDGLIKFNIYSDLGDFESFNLFDFNKKVIYINIGKLCRYIELPAGFAFPIGQILGMWSLFAKYEGMDESGKYHKFLAPTVVDKKYQATLYFDDADKKLRKLHYNEMTFDVDRFDTCIFYDNE